MDFDRCGILWLKRSGIDLVILLLLLMKCCVDGLRASMMANSSSFYLSACCSILVFNDIAIVPTVRDVDNIEKAQTGRARTSET
jgi:hypothetical protein